MTDEEFEAELEKRLEPTLAAYFKKNLEQAYQRRIDRFYRNTAAYSPVSRFFSLFCALGWGWIAFALLHIDGVGVLFAVSASIAAVSALWWTASTTLIVMEAILRWKE